MKIEDGKGTGILARVNQDGKLNVTSVTSTTEHYANHNQGKAFNLRFTVTPTGAGDCFLYMKNLSNTPITIEGMNFKLAADDYISIVLNDSGTPVDGTDITPANLNSGSAEIADGTFLQGADITGIDGGREIFKIYHASSAQTHTFNFEQDVVLRKNGIFTLYIGTGTVAIDGAIEFNYHGINN